MQTQKRPTSMLQTGNKRQPLGEEHRPFSPLPQGTLLEPLPGLLRGDLIVQAEKVKQITCTPPCVAIPMRVMAPKDLKARAYISSIMMLLEWARPDPPT